MAAGGPKIGTGYVDVQGDFSSFYRDVDRQLAPIARKFKKTGDDAGRDFGRGLDRSRSSTKGTSRDIDGLAGKLDLLGGGFRGGGNDARFFGRTLNLVKPASLITGLGLAAQGLSATGGAAVAATAALAPLTGLAGAAGVALSAAAQGAGTFALAAWGVADAVKEQLSSTGAAASGAASSASAQRAAARAVESAQDGVRSALEAVKPAMQAVTDAEKGLSAARIEARRHLIDLRDAVIDTAFAEQAAGSALTDARAALAALIPTARQVADAHESVTDSLRGEEHAALSLIDAQKTLADLLKGADPLDLADAHDTVTDSLRAEERAQLDLAAEQKKAAKVLADPKATEEAKANARLDLADAENRVEDAKRATARAQQRLNDLETKPDPHEIAKARLAVGDAENGVADAKRDSADAQAALSALEAGPSAEDLARARRDVAEAELAVARAKREHARAVRELTAAEKKGIERSDEVVAARRDLADAEHGLVDAHRQVTKAERDLADAQLSAAESATQAGAAAGKLNAKMAALPKSAQAFVRQLVGMKPLVDDLRKTAADGFFPGASAGLAAAAKNFEPLKRVVAATAGVLGGLAEKAGKLIGSKAFGKDLETIGKRNAGIIQILGDAALHFLNAIRHILVAAGPLTTWLAKVAEGWGKSAEAATASGRETGKLADFFDSTRAVLERLGSIIGNVAGAFGQIIKAAAPLGNEILAALDKSSAGFEKWTKSVSGGNTLRKYFADLKPAIFEIGGLVGDLVKVFFRIGAGTGIAPLIHQLRTELLPVFEHVVVATTAAFGPHLIHAVTQILRLFGAIAGASGPLTQFVDLVGGAAGVMANLLAGNPGLQTMVISFIGMAAVFKALKFASFITGLTGMGKAALAAGSAYKSLAAGATVSSVAQERGIGVTIAAKIATLASAAATRVQTAATAAWAAIQRLNIGLLLAVTVASVQARIVALAGAAATGVMTAAQWLLNAALTANPIGLVVVGIAALVAGFILAWQHSEKFRELVTGAFNAIAEAAGKVYEAAKHVVEQLIAGFTALPDTIIGLGRWAVDRVVEGIKAMADAISGAAGWVKNRIVEFVKAYVDVYKTIGTWVLNKIVAGFTTVTDALGAVGTWLKDKISHLVWLAGEAIKDIGVWIVDKIAAGFTTTTDALGKVGDWLKDRFVEIVGKVADGFKGVGKSIIGWIVDGLTWGLNKIIGFVNRIIGVINKIPGVDIKPIPLAKASASSAQKELASDQLGTFARGGKIDRPMFMVGEEAPRHHEYVLATNPAYRGRNVKLWERAGHDLGIPGFKLGGILGGAAGLAGDLAGSVLSKGASWFLGKLPGAGDLPAWLQGMGKFVLGKVGSWIKDKVGGLFSGGGGAVGNITGLVEQVRKALDFARGHGWHGSVSSGFRSRAEQEILYARYLAGGTLAAKPGSSSHEKGQAVDVTDTEGFAHAMSQMASGALKRLVPGEPWHFSVTGHRKGGVIGGPFVGSFATGGVVPHDGLAYVHQGERIHAVNGELGNRITLEVLFHDPTLKGLIDVRVKENDREKGAAYMAGVN